jgi:ABC-type Na+ efflux pump permease subunit
MRKILLIIKREYLTRVRTKRFIIGTIIVPLIGLGSVLLVEFLVGHTTTQSLRIVIVDNSGSLAPAIVHSLDGKLADGQPQFTVEETVSRPASLDALQRDLRARQQRKARRLSVDSARPRPIVRAAHAQS